MSKQTPEPKKGIHSMFNACMYKDQCRSAESRIAELERQLAEAQKGQADAARYRWLEKDITENGCQEVDEFAYCAEGTLSDYIDAALKE